MLLFLICSCSQSEPKEVVSARSSTSTQVSAKLTPKSEADSAKLKRKPMGSIGGIPILPTPSIVGDIDNEAVIALMKGKDKDFQACLDSETRKEKSYGKVSVYFTTDPTGKVTKSKIRSSTLRHNQTETCALEVLSSIQFPPITQGDKAVIIYPITFGSL